MGHVRNKVREGDVVYEVKAKRHPWDDEPEKIAEIVLMEELQFSEWADARLFFRHQRISRDRKYWRRKWKQLNEDVRFDKNDPDQVFGDRKNDITWPRDEKEAEERYMAQMAQWKCPFVDFMPKDWLKSL